MFGKAMIAVGAVLVLGSFSAATDASAGGRGGHGQRPSYAVKNGALHLGQRTKPSNYYNAPSAGSAANNNGNFGMSGPYVGMKYIGNVR
jgi:hypothetical protein